MDQEKFKMLVHYICWKCADDPSMLGAVKLNKILWISEGASYYSTGNSITGARYVKRQYGPVPSAILPILRDLEQEGVLTIRDADFHGFVKKEFIVNRPASPDFLSDQERGLVEDAIVFVCKMHSAKSISSATHDHIWKAAADGEEIPLFTVLAQPGKLTDDDRTWARQQLGTLAGR